MTKTKIVHILTVGTSLIENKGGENRNSDESNKIRNLNDLCCNAKGQAANGEDVSENCNLINHTKQALLELKLAKEIGYRPAGPNGPADRLPQEISYLYLKTKESPCETGQDKEKADCYLISSSSPPGKFSAKVIKEYINEQEYLKEHYCAKDPIVAEGVNVDNPEEFEKKGFRNLIDRINETIEESINGSAEKIYLNITGGFKGMVPYSTIAGMIYPSEKVILCYLFEDSDKIIKMPVYPIGLDYHHWHRNATRLRMVTEIGGAAAEFFEDNLSEPMRKLLYDDGGKKKLFSLGKALQDQYKQQTEKDPLKVYSKEIVDKIMPDDLDNNAKNLKNILKNLIDRVGDLIWVGDKIPEMVEHAHRHHHNLLVFAEMFLTPIIGPKGVKKDFMNAEERFCLLAGILLHDCGHSLDYIEAANGDIPLFPSEVRDYHHYLSYQRLNNKETAKELSWPHPGNGGDLDSKLHKAVLTVCLYHRKKMGYEKNRNGRGYFTVPFVKEKFPPLEEYIEKQNSNLPEKSEVDIMKVVALMRLIDSWDNQAERAGNREYVDHILNILKRDREIAVKRAEESMKLFENLCNMFNEKSNGFEEAKGALKDGNGDLRLNDKDSECHSFCIEKLKNGSDNDKTLARAWLAAAESIDRANMKSKQEIHYMKHQCIKEVIVIPDDSEFTQDKLSFKVKLVENEEFKHKLDDGNEFSDELGEELKEQIASNSYVTPTLRNFIELKEVTPEYTDIKDYLQSNYNITLKYYWEKTEEAGRTILSKINIIS